MNWILHTGLKTAAIITEAAFKQLSRQAPGGTATRRKHGNYIEKAVRVGCKEGN